MPSKTSVAKTICGLISVLAVPVVMDDHPLAAWRGAVTPFAAILAVVLVDAYSEAVAEMLSHQRGPRAPRIERDLAQRLARPRRCSINPGFTWPGPAG